MRGETDFYREAFSRNIGLVTLEQQQKIKHTTVAIAGLGGVGGIHASTLARLGIGAFHISDPDSFEEANLNRQAGATLHTIGQSKAEAIKNLIHSINPFARVEVFAEGIDEKNIEPFLRGVDIVIDGLDFFCMQPRRLLFRRAKRNNIFALTAGPIGFGSSLLVFDPQGMAFDSYFDIADDQTEKEMLVRFGLGITPTLMQRAYFPPDAVNWNDKKAPSLVMGTLLAANLVSCEVVKIALGEKIRPAPASLHFDPYVRKLKKTYIPFGNKNPWQRLKLMIATIKLKHQGRF